MLKLIVMRHAKSSWANFGQADHDRPLNKRGKVSAKAMGDWLRSRGHVPDQVLSSSSERTGQTFLALDFKVPVQFTRALYHADPDDILGELQQATEPTVLILGHNPGIGAFASRIVTAPPDHARFYDYPTCATLVARIDAPDWSSLTWGSAQAIDFAIPREVLT